MPVDPQLVSDTLWAKCEPLIAAFDPESLPYSRQIVNTLLVQVLRGEKSNDLHGAQGDVQQVVTRWRNSGLLKALSATTLIELDPAP